MILGMIQGLCEFLPISSSAHLVLVPWLFHWQDPGLGFDVALHMGTLVAVLAYFQRDVRLLILGGWRSLFRSTRNLQNDIHQRMAWLLVIASIPGAVVGKLFEEQAEHLFRAPVLIAVMLGGFGLILWLADRYGHKRKSLDSILWWEALMIGLSQALAIIPGVSRSGSTIVAGLGLGFRREEAARFSFLMSIPIILGAGLAHAAPIANSAQPLELAIGFLSSLLFGFLAIRCLLRYIVRYDFNIFVCYRLALALGILLCVYVRAH